MEWIERLNNAIRYIEENILEDISIEEIAKIAGCSTYHFQRIFSYMANIPLSEYIRRRKMSLAAVDLQNRENRVVDISMKYGYNSPTAFNRAFKKVHNIAPSQIKNSGQQIKAFLPISFSISIKGDIAMNYRIEEKESFRVIGVSKSLYNEIEKNFEIVPKMWEEEAKKGTIQKLALRMEGDPKGLLGVSACNKVDEWKYFIAVSNNDANDNFFEKLIIPKSTWAIFEGSGNAKDIQQLEQRIVTEWLPTSGYEYSNAPDIEVYMSENIKDMRFEVWIPVKKRED